MNNVNTLRNEPRTSPKFDISTLPADHPPYQLAQARQFYDGDLEGPPFVLTEPLAKPRANRESEMYRPVLLAPDKHWSSRLERNCLNFSKPIVLIMVRRAYDLGTSFWTLDFNRTRWIVKNFPGGSEFLHGTDYGPKPSGSYRCWLGVDKPLLECPVVAFNAPADLFSAVEPPPDPDFDWPHTGFSHRFFSSCLTSLKLNLGWDASSGGTSSTISKSSDQAENLGSKAKYPIVRITSGQNDKPNMPNLGMTLPFHISPKSAKCVRMGMAPDDTTKTRTVDSLFLEETESTMNSLSSDNASNVSIYEDQNSQSSRLSSASLVSGSSPKLATPSPPFSYALPSQPENTPILSPYKIRNTKLYICLGPTTSGFVPLRLSSCRTLTMFFENVTKALGCEADDLLSVRVGFDSLPDMDLVVRRDLEDTFEEMLEIIGEAPCWGGEGGNGKEMGKCVVRIQRVC